MTRGILALLVVAVLALLAPSASAVVRHPAQPGKVVVTGEIAHRRALNFADLRALPQHTCTGPLLLDVAGAVKPRFDAAVKNDQLRFFVAATASDGYRAIVSWAEIDPGFAGTPVLLAVSEDGATLDQTGPRLVVPGDVKGGRYVSAVTRLHIGSVDRLVR
ncbi:hypothetical protein [Actinocorallia longicatena]|uniref:Molybdopterin-binding oxidoreductase n=1 Tax=Actinocorallia longicatena TaxID=111803 RepID=A0ABP6PY87_9ACTN